MPWLNDRTQEATLQSAQVTIIMMITLSYTLALVCVTSDLTVFIVAIVMQCVLALHFVRF